MTKNNQATITFLSKAAHLLVKDSPQLSQDFGYKLNQLRKSRQSPRSSKRKDDELCFKCSQILVPQTSKLSIALNSEVTEHSCLFCKYKWNEHKKAKIEAVVADVLQYDNKCSKKKRRKMDLTAIIQAAKIADISAQSYNLGDFISQL